MSDPWWILCEVVLGGGHGFHEIGLSPAISKRSRFSATRR